MERVRQLHSFGRLVESIGGRLSSPRSIHILLDGQTIAYGTDVDRDGISDDASAFTVVFAGMGASGQRLTFVREK